METEKAQHKFEIVAEEVVLSIHQVIFIDKASRNLHASILFDLQWKLNFNIDKD